MSRACVSLDTVIIIGVLRLNLLPVQFVHSVIDGVCEKQGVRYETFAKALSLAEFSRLLRTVEGAVRWVGREGGTKQQVHSIWK